MTNDLADRLAGRIITMDEPLEGEFEARLGDSSSLAFRVALSVLRHREDAEDVAQEALVKAYRKFGQLRDRARFRAWLVRMTWRLALDRLRATRRQRQREAGVVEHAHDESAVEGVLAQERAQQLWAAIDALPDKLRIVILLAAMEEHDVAEVARLLRLPAGTVKSRLFSARQRLKDALQWMRTDR